MKIINQMIVALYRREQKSMKYSEGNARLFVAKLVFCLLIWIWLLPIIGILEHIIDRISIISYLPDGRLFAFLIAIILYFILNSFTWKLKEIDEYSSNEDNESSIRKAKSLFFTLLIIGFIFLIAVAKYNQANPILD